MEQMLLPILMFAGLGGLMYFSMKKQKRVAAATKQMHESLVPGARVMTTSGLHGTVTAIADDTIELEIAPGTADHLGARRGPRDRRSRPDRGQPRRSMRDYDDRRRGRSTPRRSTRPTTSVTDRKSKDLN